MTRQTIRFWHFGAAPVLIKMRAGQTLNHSSGGRTDEGWSRSSNSWTFDGETVVCEWVNDGCDCDGRLTRSGEAYFAADKAMAGYRDDEDGVTYPDWQHGDSGQRDYAAEAMGY